MKAKTILRLSALMLLVISLACKTPSISGSEQSIGPCDNVLYPFFFGAHWLYQVDRQDGSEATRFGLTVTKVANSQATIESLDIKTGIMTEIIADCDNGAIRNYPVLSQNMLIGNAVASDFHMEYVSGLFAPAVETFNENDWLHSWTADYLINGTITIQAQGETVTVNLENTPLHMAWETAGPGETAFETVNIPAGTFEKALKVRYETSMDVSITLAGIPLHGQLTLHMTEWFEPFTGLLKMQIDSGEVNALGINIPVTLKGTIELVEYFTAH